MGYGFTVLYRINKEIKDLSKFRFTYQFGEFSDWQIAIRLFYKFTIIFRLNLNR